MSATNSSPIEFLDAIQRDQGRRAQRWWFVAKGLSIAIFILGLAATLDNNLAQEIGAASVIIAVTYALAEWRAGYLWRVAQSLLRKFEFYDGLGWAVTPRELSNLQLRIPLSLRRQLEQAPPELNQYYAAETNPSPRRLIENLAESSWYTKHLAERLAIYFVVITVTLVLISVIVAVVALQSTVTQPSDEVMAKAVVAVIVFVFTAGYVRYTFEYNRFFREAELIEQKACTLLDKPEIKPEEAVNLYTDYQFLREGSPPILTPVWKMMRTELNKSWDRYRRA